MIQILYCLRSPAQREQLQALCRHSGLSCKPLQAGDSGKTVSALLQLGLPVRKPNGDPPPFLWQPPEFILMSGIQRPRMEDFLDACGALGISREVLKAMVTPFNASWTLYTLLTQLQAEHGMLQNP